MPPYVLTVYQRIFQNPLLNIGILQMTGEVTDRLNEGTLFGMALFSQKAIEFLQNL